jgi:hypothetical protein
MSKMTIDSSTLLSIEFNHLFNMIDQYEKDANDIEWFFSHHQLPVRETKQFYKWYTKTREGIIPFSEFYLLLTSAKRNALLDFK